MKLLQIDVCANVTSTGKIAESIGLLAQKNGFESFIAWGREHRKSQSHLIHIGNTLNYIEHGIETRLFDNHGLASRLSTLCFLKALKKIKPDLVHLHCIHGYYLNYVYLFKYLKEMNVPVVWTMHDCWAFTGHCAHFDLCGCNKWMTKCHSCPQRSVYPSTSFFDRSAKNFENKQKSFNSISNLTLVSVSQWLDDLVSRSFLGRNKHIVIKNGIDTNVFSPIANKQLVKNKLGISEDETMLLGVAYPWSRRKGLQDFIELSKLLSDKHRIVLIGLTVKQSRSLPHNIIGIERTTSLKELAEYYSAADLFLNLTYEDNYPTTNLEAISCGTPCLTYRTGGSPESITPETGFVVSQGDLTSVLQCIELIQKNGKQAYYQPCRDYALAHFRAEDRFQDYINLYKQILNI